ncbi:ribonuclease PH [bacterium]|nr:ribonuclease PH [bacterium]
MSNSSVRRYAERSFNELRKIKATFNSFGYASGSVLFEMGRTKVLCAVSMQHKVPPFLRGKKKGWLTAEYAMLPTSTGVRTQRESSTMKKNGRSVEISRLIGRSLRTIVDFNLLGERTIIVDCDVLQADGGTRTACITGASLALRIAVNKWLQDKTLRSDILTGSVAALSVGWLQGQALLDLDFSEDSKADADFNIVMTKAGNLVEFQGAVEGSTLSWDQFEQVRSLAAFGVNSLFEECQKLVEINLARREQYKNQANKKSAGTSLFSLQNRNQSR